MKTTRWLLSLTTVCTLASLTTPAATIHVWQESPRPASPYGDWASAAHSIQDAVDAARPGDTVRVTNGVYATGGRAVYLTMTNRVAIDKAITVLSTDGPAVTVIAGAEAPGGGVGDGAIRCAYVGDHATLSGFTLSNGHTLTDHDWDSARSGGGIFCEALGTVTNCVLTGNTASDYGGGAYGGALRNCILTNNSAWEGGGAAGGTLYHCTLSGNRARNGGGANQSTLTHCILTGNSAQSGGGAYYGRLNNCLLTSNSASQDGGGATGCTLNNCIIYFNSAEDAANYNTSTLNFCCTTPLPSDGFGNITNEPAFVDYPTGNLRLQSNSACINAGNNAYATTPSDLDGNPRIVSSTVDIGAYEYQGTGSVISYAWLQQHHLPTDGSADFDDADGDLMNNRQEWIADTDPSNAASCLRLNILPNSVPVSVTFSSSSARLYTLLRCTNLASAPLGPIWTRLLNQTDVTGTGGLLTLADTNQPAPAFYRVSVSFR